MEGSLLLLCSSWLLSLWKSVPSSLSRLRLLHAGHHAALSLCRKCRCSQCNRNAEVCRSSTSHLLQHGQLTWHESQLWRAGGPPALQGCQDYYHPHHPSSSLLAPCCLAAPPPVLAWSCLVGRYPAESRGLEKVPVLGCPCRGSSPDHLALLASHPASLPVQTHLTALRQAMGGRAQQDC